MACPASRSGAVLFILRLNQPSLTPVRPCRWIGLGLELLRLPWFATCFQQDIIQFYKHRRHLLRREERDGSTFHLRVHPTRQRVRRPVRRTGSRVVPSATTYPDELPGRTSSRCTKVTTRLLPLPGKQTKPPSSPVRRVASAGQTLADLQC